MKDVLKLLKYFALGIAGLFCLFVTYEFGRQAVKNISYWMSPTPSLEELVKQDKIVEGERKPANR